jgi:SAM-dependent methyltransferase
MENLILKECRICADALSLEEKFTGMPLAASILSEHPSQPVYSDVNLYRCLTCGLYQIPLIKERVYSSELISTNGKQLMDDRRNSFDYLSSISLEHNRILEIGCRTGIMFDMAVEYYKEVIGVEPSENCARKAAERGHTVINDYFRVDLPFNGTFDAFYSLAVFEHVDTPAQIMKDVYAVLKEGGTGWIEVPNGQTIIDEAQYFSIFPDHLQYYTPHSLSVLAYLSGFETLLIRPSLGKDHLEIFVRKPMTKQTLTERKGQQCSTIINIASNYTNVVIWGAGGKSHTIFGYLQNGLNIKHIVDIDPAKHGLYIPGVSVPVESPSKQIFDTADVVIIFSASYEKEITKTLREEYNYTGKIVCLSEN